MIPWVRLPVVVLAVKDTGRYAIRKSMATAPFVPEQMLAANALDPADHWVSPAHILASAAMRQATSDGTLG
jgi:hypothetical protein